MQLTTDTGLMLLAYSAEPGTRSEQALNLFASWAASPQEAQTPEVAHEL